MKGTNSLYSMTPSSFSSDSHKTSRICLCAVHMQCEHGARACMLHGHCVCMGVVRVPLPVTEAELR
jgi:hypothetical protein